MASQQDLQELLRVITSRKGVSMMVAMGQVKALQAVGLRSIQQINEAPFDLVERALGDAKTARSLLTAFKTHSKRPSTKRAGDSLNNASDKRAKQQHNSSDSEAAGIGVKEQEDALALPVVTNEEEMAEASIYTNRAPLMLAFVLELLRYTMPVQPLSSRLSLAQAVTSANARTKAVGIGLARASGEDGSWSEGQPKVNIMGRTIAVLKRGEYKLETDETVVPVRSDGTPGTVPRVTSGPSGVTLQGRGNAASTTLPWSTSRQITFKSSTFVARVTSVEDSGQVSALVHSLLLSEPHLQTATHNAWAYRVPKQGRVAGMGEVHEACEDDGETGCGEFILRLMREAGVVDVVVVLSRWFGGEMLGPDRWRLMRNVVTEALSQRLRVPQSEVGCDDVALWALGFQSTNDRPGESGSARTPNDWNHDVVGASIYRPESARMYLLKSFSSDHYDNSATRGGGEGGLEGNTSRAKGKKLSKPEAEAERLRNLGLLLGALRLLFESWSNLTPLEMDRRAFSWYATIRPHVEQGMAGWGAKGWLKLSDILQLRRNSEGKEK
ncbi:protein IMPACT-B [Colletotrichum spaethianum]|uniref:Protein IMPACT-B n=1 Tax=Colletotrichum spaethianum TaxID=700344 RepID=A0AA37P7I6_9PEZI|nr:protein IMPACT-B [Colletotrichum spaethianum]GKT44104.1 protein IMPACT-B [Colletotrichum spaethianum]